MADASTVDLNTGSSESTTKISYPYPPSEIFQLIVNRIHHPYVKEYITGLNISWVPRRIDFLKLARIAKKSKDAVKTILYIPKDMRTPDVFMGPNGPIQISFSELIDEIAKFEKHIPVQGLENLARSFMLTGFEPVYCDSCDRVCASPTDITSSKVLADFYNLELKENINLCSFEFMSLCAEIEYLYPESIEVKPLPTLPDGRPVIWIGDPGWEKYPREYQELCLKYQGNF